MTAGTVLLLDILPSGHFKETTSSPWILITYALVHVHGIRIVYNPRCVETQTIVNADAEFMCLLLKCNKKQLQELIMRKDFIPNSSLQAQWR